MLVDRALTLPDLLAAAAERHGDAPAHISGETDTALSFGAWDRRATSVAAGLAARGVRRGDAIGLCFSSREWQDLSIAYVGIQRAGATCVLMSSDWAAAEITDVAAQGRCVGIVCGSDHKPTGAVWEERLDDLAQSTAAPSGGALDPGATADILFTSGTTGHPKGVAYTQRNACFEAQWRGGAIPSVVPGGACIHAHPPQGASGQGRIVLPLIAGVPLYSMSVFDPRAFCDLVEAYSVPHVSLVPAMAVALLEWEHLPRYSFDSVRVVSFGSAAVADETLAGLGNRFHRAQLINQYSSTEALPARVRGVFGAHAPGTIGVPDHDTRISVRDPETGEELPAGASGEIWLSVPGVDPRWYHDDPVATAEVFVDGWTRMGDIGYLTSDGELVLTDRLKDIINRGGTNISPREVEDVLREHPDIVDVAVVGLPHRVLGDEVAAAVVVRGPVSERDIRDFAARRLSDVKVPKRLAFCDELPRTPNGKVRREDLLSLWPAEGPGGKQGTRGEQLTATEAALAAIWTQVLRVVVGPSDDFFDLGGTSLEAVQISGRAEDAGLPVEPADLSDFPTLSELAREVDARSSRTDRPTRSPAADG